MNHIFVVIGVSLVILFSLLDLGLVYKFPRYIKEDSDCVIDFMLLSDAVVLLGFVLIVENL